jgi:hypothetical protein
MATISQKSFSGGEITPSLYARTDVAKYATALRTCRNYTVLKHGGVEARPGTSFIGEVKDSSEAVRLIPFNFSLTDNYMLEFGNLYIRFIKNGSYIYESTKTITGITSADPGVVTTSGAHGYLDGEEVQINAVIGMTELNGRNFKVANKTATTFELQDMDSVDYDTSGLTAYGSAGTTARIYEIVSPYSDTVVPNLTYVQAADVLSMTELTVGEKHLARTNDTSWAFATRNIRTEGGGTKPTGTPTVSGASGTVSQWKIYAKYIDGSRQAFSIIPGSDTIPSSGATRTITVPTISAGSGTLAASSYDIFRKDNGVKASTAFYVYIGSVEEDGTNTFVDNGDVADTDLDVSSNFSWDSGSTVAFASAICYYQQRFLYGGGATAGEEESIVGSKNGDFENFYNSYHPIAADNPFRFDIRGRSINPVRHLLDLNGLVIFTENSELIAAGDANGVLTPTDVNLRTQSYHGSGKLAPLVVDNTAIFVQARGSIVRDFQYSESVKGYSGRDLSIFSSHLFDGYTIDDWCFQKVPNSTVWAVRSDGVLLGMTYVKEHEVLAWHRHDFDGGVVESVESIPGATADEDALYVVVKRTINGVVKRFVELMDTSQVSDIKDVKRMDSYVTYDGRNTGATTMTLSGGTTWAYDETITLTASTAYFDSADTANEIHITAADGTIIRFDIVTFSSTTVVTGLPNKTVPAAMQGTAYTNWGKAKNVIDGLWHLEGEAVSSFSDGFVTSSPNNAAYTTLTVASGSVTLDDHYTVSHIGLPYTADIETLDVDVSQGETARDKKHMVSQVNLFVEDTRGLWVGPKPPSDDTSDPLEDLYEIKVRQSETMDAPVDLKTEVLNVKIKSEWNGNGRVFIRQVDPVPSTILSIMPEGNFTFRG